MFAEDDLLVLGFHTVRKVDSKASYSSADLGVHIHVVYMTVYV